MAVSERNRVKLKICGTEFVVTSDDSEEYMRRTAEAVEKRIVMMTNSSSGMSVSKAAMFTALELCDEKQKAAQSAENMRTQIQGYLEEAAHAKSEAAELRRREQSLTRENQELRQKLSGLRR